MDYTKFEIAVGEMLIEKYCWPSDYLQTQKKGMEFYLKGYHRKDYPVEKAAKMLHQLLSPICL